MLVYKLVLSEPGITLSAACFNDAQQKLNDVLGNWEQEIASHTGQAPRNLVHLLESSDLGLDLLEDEDHLKACRLMTACQTRGFCFFWATMKYTFTRYLDEANYNGDHCPCCLQLTNDPDAWDGSEERSCRLLAIHAPDGQSLARDVKIDQLSVIQDHVFGPNAEPDEYDTAGRSIRGDRWNDSESDGGSFQHGLTYIYHRNCVLLVPRAFRFEFLFKGKSLDGLSFSVWINILLQEIEGQSLYMASKEELKELCRHIVESWPSMNEHGKESFRNALELVVTAALRLNDPDLFQSTLSYPVAKKLSPMAFDRVGRSVGELELGNWEQRSVLFALIYSISTNRPTV